MAPIYTKQITRNIELKVGRGTVYIDTDKGLQRIKTFAKKHNSLDYIANGGIGLVVITGLLSVVLFSLAALSSAGTEPTPANEPKNAVLIPGVNDFIPLTATLDVLIVVLVSAAVHEFAHALLAFRADYTVEEWGVVLLLGIIPAGAYVKIPPEEIKEGGMWDSLRVLSAGIMANYILFAVTIAIALFANIPLIDGYQYYLQVLPSVSSQVEISVITSLGFWMAFLNINLAAVNSLPIYGLDGGHMLDVICEATESVIFKKSVVFVVTGTTLLIVGSMFFVPFIT